jgi:hypothetical protein
MLVRALRLKSGQRFRWTGAACVCTGHYSDLYARATVTEEVPARTVFGVELEAMPVGTVVAIPPDTRVGLDEHTRPDEQPSQASA